MQGTEKGVVSGQRSGAAYGEQASVDAGGGAVSDFSESEGDNADVIEQRGRPDEQAGTPGFCDCRPSREWRCNFRSIYWQNGSTSAGMDQKVTWVKVGKHVQTPCREKSWRPTADDPRIRGQARWYGKSSLNA